MNKEEKKQLKKFIEWILNGICNKIRTKTNGGYHIGHNKMKNQSKSDSLYQL